MKHGRTVVLPSRLVKSEDITAWLNKEIEEAAPAFKKKHVLIPIDASDALERARPWQRGAKFESDNEMVNLLTGCLNAVRPGVFVVVACGSRPQNKYEVFSVIKASKGYAGEALASPVETVLVEPECGKSKKSGVAQGRNVETVMTIASAKHCDWHKMKKKVRLFDEKKTTWSLDMALEYQPPSLALQLTPAAKVEMLHLKVAKSHKFDESPLAEIPDDVTRKRRWCKRHGLSKGIRGCFPLYWRCKTSKTWMEILWPLVIPSKIVLLDPFAGSGMKFSAGVCLPVASVAVCMNLKHEQHILQVADLEIVKEFCREASFWHMKESAEKINALFQQFVEVSIADDSDSASGSVTE